VQQLLAERVLGPLGLDNTTDPGTPAITEPALHAYSSERRYALKIPAAVPFTEDVTYWNPSWTITHGAIQTTNIDDKHTGIVGGVDSGRTHGRRALTCRDEFRPGRGSL
jgi:hypothetical protein